MKIKLFLTMIAATLFLGANIQAEQLDFQSEATDEVMNALHQEGVLKDLNDDELKNVESLVASTIAFELSNHDVEKLSLDDGAKQAFLGGIFDKIKSAVSKGFEFIKGGVKKVTDVAKRLAGKAAAIVSTYGPKFIGFAKNLLPMLAPLATNLATKLGLPANLVQGVLGSLSPAEQQQVANNPDAAATLVEQKLGQ